MKYAAVAIALASFLLVVPSRAQSKSAESAAKALQKKAMQEDYVATDFEKAADRLNQAITKCGAEKCGVTTRAELRRDLGVVLIGGQVDREKGLVAWLEAMRLDPGIQLENDFKTKELEQLFDQTKKAALGMGGAAAAPKKPVEGGPPAGDFTITPFAEQVVRTPVPIYVEYNGSEKVVRVIAKYKGFGMTDWRTLELRRLEKGYGAVTPCVDVQQGEFQYYVQGFDAANDPVASSGDRNNPFRVAVRSSISLEAPHLPGQPAPKQCAEAGDCPPGLPGCDKPVASSLKDGGEECTEDETCKSNQCSAGRCTEPESAAPPTFSRVWLGISGAIDFAFLPSRTNVCTLTQQANGKYVSPSGYFCINPDGTDFPSDAAQNGNIRNDTLNSITGGAALANVRVLVSFDYAFTANLMVGARVGYVINTVPGTLAKNQGRAFPPVHIEARGTWVFGRDALAKTGLAPFVFLGGGVGQYSSPLDVRVRVTGATPEDRTVKAWFVGGPGFFTVGAGGRYAIAPRAAMSLAVKFDGAVGGPGFLPSIAPELGVQFGF